MHYYQHHIGDFIKATARLSDSQTIAYLRLLWMYYDTEKPLILDTELLAFQIGTSIQDTELLLRTFFILTDEGWKQTRCEEEISSYREFLNKKSMAGRASAEQRKNIRSTPVQQTLNDSSTDVQLTTNHKPITNINIYNDQFEMFWKSYPKKTAKESAKKAWLKIKPNDELIAKITKAVKDQKLSDREQQFIPHAATWLNNKRWEDEIAGTTQKPLMGWK
jgi:uncharacterized protein YdaU (DUF1376 family)